MIFNEITKAQLNSVVVPYKGETLSTSILEKAVTLSDGFHNFRITSSYAGEDLPKSNYKYSFASVFKRGNTSITVVLWAYNSSGCRNIAFNLYNGVWYGWQTIVTTADLTTALEGYMKNTGGGSYLTNTANNAILGARNDMGSIALRVGGTSGDHGVYSDTLKKWLLSATVNGDVIVNGTATGNLDINAYNSVTKNGNLLTELCIYGKTVHHDGNSSKVAISESAPTDTSALWVW